MHRSLKPHVQAKKVPPPAIPGDTLIQQTQQQQQQHIPLYRLGGSINSATCSNKHHTDDGGGSGSNIIMSSLVTSPSLEEGGFNLPRETSVALRIKDEVDYQQTTTTAMNAAPTGAAQLQAVGAPIVVAAGSNVVKALPPTNATNPLLGVVPCPSVPAFCATLREPLTHKAAVYYHQQLALQEDQGIDLTQSPGRDSPGSSSGSAGSGSRHSTASLDSGRASSYLTGVSGAGSIRGSSGGGSTAGGGALSSPRCSSVSSCSIGSVDRQRNDELIIDWLIEMKCEEYAQLFIAAGYDLPTIARMTPEDLTAIGIKNPHHRERIKQRIDKLQVLDNLPHFVPGSIEEWLQLLRLEEYIQPLLDQNYKTVRDVTQVTWEDLEDIGIVKLGHQKKILLAIKRVKDIISGKWNPGGMNAYHQQTYTKIGPLSPMAVPMPTAPPFSPSTARVSSWDDSKTYGNSNGEPVAYYCTGSNHECCSGNDVVLIKVRQPRGKSLESLEDIHDNSTRSHLTFSHYTTTDYGHFGHPTTQQQQQHHQLLQQQQLHHLQQQQAALMSGQRLLSNPAAMSWRRSYDDGDITPTNDATRELMYEEGGGTLPRQQRGILQRAVLNTMPPIEHHHYMNAAAAAGLGGGGATSGSGVLVDTAGLGAGYLTGSPLNSKKIAPEPPRRHCSIRNSRTLSSDGSNLQIHPQQQQQQQQTLHNVQAAALYYGATGVGGMLPAMHAHPHGGGGYLSQQQQQQLQQQQQQSAQPIYANYATIQQTTAEIHCEKFHDNKSNSSIDSIDTIPFANENTGTIKQRLLNRQDMNAQNAITAAAAQQQQQHANAQQQQSHNLHSSSSSSSSSSTNTIANITHSFHSLKSSASLHDASLIRSDSIGSNTSGGSAGAPVQMCSSSMVHLRSPTLQYPPTMDGGLGGGTITTTVDLHAPNTGGSSSLSSPDVSHNASAIVGGVVNSAIATAAATATAPTTNTPKVSANVLNDIGNMLANLTDELDAMLEEEKRAGLNIDSE